MADFAKKICTGKGSCGKELDINCFKLINDKRCKSSYRMGICISCYKENQKNAMRAKRLNPEFNKKCVEDSIKYYWNHVEEKKIYNKKYREEHKPTPRPKKTKEEKKQYQKEYNKIYQESEAYKKSHNLANKKWREKNRDKSKALLNAWRNKEIKKNPTYRLRTLISTCVKDALKRNNSSKNGGSVLNFLPYTINELKAHIESLWEPWMNWNNYGVYRVSGPKTWQIDHIIPQSKLPYDSMEHPNFLKCWALENLRPLDSELNLRKGNKYG